MALVLKDRVKETTTSTGTGTINLAGAVTGFEGFVSAVGDGNTCYYTILDADGSAWEVGIGTVTDAATDTLSRDTILESSNSDNAISLTSGTHTVFLTYPADKSVYRNSNDQIVATASGIVFSDSTAQTTAAAVSGDNVSIFVNDAGYLTTESDTLQTVTDRGSNTTNSITSSGNITATTGILDVLDLTLLGNGEQPSQSEGVVFYDSENHTLSLYNDEADVTLQLGQEEFLRVRNNTGGTIYNGSGVRITGAHGASAPTVVPAIATTEEKSQIVGLATHDIENETFGYVTTYGIVRDVNTAAFSAGDELFLDASTSGNLTNVSPTIPNRKVTVGHVIRSHVNGSILVQIGHPKLGGGDLKSETTVALSGVPFVTTVADTNAGGMQTNSSFVYDSGNNQLQLGSGVQLLNAVPGNTTNVLYNDGGTLKFNGSAVDTDTTYTAGSGLELDSTTFNAKTATTSASGITTLTNTIDSTQTKALTPKAVNDAGYLTAHPSISAASDSNNSGRTYIQDLLLDSNGHVTGITTATETVTDTNTTYTAGSGLQLNGTVFEALTATTSGSGITILTNTINSDQDKALTPKSVNDAGYLTAHPSISAASSSDNSGRTYIQDLLLDSNGHVTGVATATETVTDTNTTYTAGTGLLLSGTEFNVSGVDTSLLQGTISTAQIADNAVTLAKLAGGTDGQIITFDANGDPVAVGPGTDGQVLTSTGPGSPPAFEDASGGSARSVAGDTDNGVITWVTSDNTFAVEAGLTYTGGTLTATGIIDVTNTLDATDNTGDTGAIRTEGGVSIAKKLYVGTDLDVDGTTNLDVVDIDGDVQLDGTLTVGVDGTGKDVKLYGDTTGSYLEWDQSEDRLNLVGGAYVNEAVPANDTPTTEDATVTLDLSLGNYHNISLGDNVTKFEFTNAKRGQRFILRITQNASSAKTVAWTNVDSDTGGTAATVRWAGNITPTMSTATSHTDVYGFLCTNNAGTNFDGFIIGQDLPD